MLVAPLRECARLESRTQRRPHGMHEQLQRLMKEYWVRVVHTQLPHGMHEQLDRLRA